MIIAVEDVRCLVECDRLADDNVKMQFAAIESVIRAYTNNNFQNREIRFVGASDGMNVYGDSRFMDVGDTVQISASGVNDGLYVVEYVDTDGIQVDRELKATNYNMVTKVQYPPDVIQCALDLFKWKMSMGAKVGIKSETISRHSVTYEDSTTLFMGFPIGILNGLNLYKKARC